MSVPTPAPTVGRIVHFRLSPNDAPKAAIVSVVHEPAGVVGLHVFEPEGGVKAYAAVAYGDDNARGGRWSWPPRD